MLRVLSWTNARLGQYVMELPHNLILPFIQANIAYFLMGLQGLVDKW